MNGAGQSKNLNVKIAENSPSQNKKLDKIPKDYIITTRYRGSKTRVIPLIFRALKNIEYHSVLDCFGGTAAVSYFFKKLGKKVVYNDHLQFNYIVGRALIENSKTKITNKDLDRILQPKAYNEYSHVIEENFKDIYYLDKENQWLDCVISNIYEMPEGYKRDMAMWCLFQSCIIKRPFSLFHRKNLNLRLRDVKRSFGNKTTWDKPFELHFRNFAKELNGYIFDLGVECKAVSQDILTLNTQQVFPNGIDLVYIDPPYIPVKGENIIYRDIYHFLEGITMYHDWKSKIDQRSKHKRLKTKYNPWNDKKCVESVFEELIERFQKSILLISHRSDGIPTKEVIIEILSKYKKSVNVVDSIDHKYALSNRHSKEILIMAI